MVYQMPCPEPDKLFIASSSHDDNRAETEISRWANDHGYHVSLKSPTFIFYLDGTEAREWRLIERN